MSRSGRVTRFLFHPEEDTWVSIYRVGLGISLLAYCASLWVSWHSLLSSTGDGVIGRQLSEAALSIESRAIPGVSWLIPIGATIGLDEKQTIAALWIVLAAAAVLLVAGLFCRAAAITTWFVQLSVVKSAALFSYGADNLLTISLFYLMLTPLPDRYAVEHYLWPSGKLKPDAVGFFRRVLQIHVCFIYFFGGLTKCLGPGWWNGLSLWRALNSPPFNVLPHELLAQMKFILPPAGIAIWLIELSFPFFIWPAKTRLLWLSLVCALHLAIALAMGMYLFGLIMIVLDLAAFAPLTRRRRAATAPRLTVAEAYASP